LPGIGPKPGHPASTNDLANRSSPASAKFRWDYDVPPHIKFCDGSDLPDISNLVISPSMEDAIEDEEASESADPEIYVVPGWEGEEGEGEGEGMHWEEAQSVATSGEVQESLWDDAPPESATPQMLCTAHGVACKKGICGQYAQQLREAKKKEWAEKDSARDSEKRKKKKGKGKGKAKDGVCYAIVAVRADEADDEVAALESLASSSNREFVDPWDSASISESTIWRKQDKGKQKATIEEVGGWRRSDRAL
jgi:hypothetical protein